MRAAFPLAFAAPPVVGFGAGAPVVEEVELVFEELELPAEAPDSLDEGVRPLADVAGWTSEDPPHAASARAASTGPDTARAALDLLRIVRVIGFLCSLI